MKPAVHLLTLCAVVCAFHLAGCSKSKKAPPPAATNAAPQQAAAPAKPKEMVELKAKVPAGKKLVQRIQISQSREAAGPNQPKAAKTSLDLAQEVSFSVLAAASGYEMEMEILSQKIESKVGDKTVFVFDSSQDRKLDAKIPLAKDFRKLVGGKVKLLANAQGKVEKTDGYQAFIRKATLASSPQAVGMIRSLFSEEAIKQMALTHHGLPDKSIAIGEGWNTQSEQPGGLKVEMDYTVKGIEEREGRKCILVESKGSITKKGASGPADPAAASPEAAPVSSVDPGAPPEAAGAPQSPAAPPSKPGEVGTLNGKLWFDPAAGLIVEFQVEHSTAGAQSTVRTVNKLIEVSDLAK